MKIVQKYIYAIAMLMCGIVLGLFLMLTNPDNVSIGLLVVPVVLFFLIAFCAAHLLMSGMRILSSHPRRKRTIALLSASLLSVIVILQSTGGISGTDVLLLALIISVSGIYISKF